MNSDLAGSLDEAALIEERRKRREAIKAKHRDQASPAIMPTSPSSKIEGIPEQPVATHSDQSPAERRIPSHELYQIAYLQMEGRRSIDASRPETPEELMSTNSPILPFVNDDADLANGNAIIESMPQEEEPSAADYDPTMDMQEDKFRQTQQARKDDGHSCAFYESKDKAQNSVRLEDALHGPEPASRFSNNEASDFDMFADEDQNDIFAQKQGFPKPEQSTIESAKATMAASAQAIDMTMLDDWDDNDGYYKVTLGELLDNRYHVQSSLGKGMFSGVVRATDQRTKDLVAIKIIRNNETM